MKANPLAVVVRVLVLAWCMAIIGLLLTLAAMLPIIVGLAVFSSAPFIAQTTTTSFVGEWSRVGWLAVVALIPVIAIASALVEHHRGEKLAVRLRRAALRP